MNKSHIFLILILTVFSNNLAAYGSSSSSKKACKKPAFSEFTPAASSVVSPGTDFSFVASSVTLPHSIQVTIKNEPVDIDISDNNGKYKVTGKLPPNLQGVFARINIQAYGPKKCKGKGGWLLQISDQ